jgi:tetratricopeptide (TPR) repeat protein
MKLLLFVCVIFISVLFVNAQTEKTFTDLKNEGNAAIQINDFPHALDLYEQALVKMGNQSIVDTSMIYDMGYCAFRAKNNEKALKYFDRAISMNYNTVNAYLYKADVYKLMKNKAESLKSLEAAYAIDPNDSKVKSKLAGVYIKEANVYYTAGAIILKNAANDVAAAKYKITDEPYKQAGNKAKVEFGKVLPLAEKALSYDPGNVTAKQLKTSCENALK